MAEAVTIPPGLCGFAIGDKTGQCVFTPHRLGTPHSWAPDLQAEWPKWANPNDPFRPRK